MYADACELFRNMSCQIGFSRNGKPTGGAGSGCMIAPGFMITAQHVIDGCPEGARIVAVTAGGVDAFEPAWSDAKSDVAILRRVEAANATEEPPPSNFPKWPTVSPRLGMSVGYLSWLRLPTHSMTCFSQSFLSGLLPKIREFVGS